MRYTLVGRVNGEPVQVASPKEEHVATREAREGLLRILAIEEKSDLLLENYDELEGEMATIIRRAALFEVTRSEERTGEIHRVNRRLLIFLTTARVYADHVAHNLSVLFGKRSSELQAFRQACSDRYDALVGYRVMEALRNYCQHRDIPVHSLRYGAALQRDAGGRIEHYLKPSVKVARLADEGGLKPKVMHDLQALGDEADLKPLVREYVSGLIQVHRRVREIVSPYELRQMGIFEDAQRRLAADAGGGQAVLLEGLVWKADQRGRERVHQRIVLSGHFRARLDALRRKNTRGIDLTRHVHTS